MDVAGGVWMVFITWPWLGYAVFDMGYDSAEYKGAGLYVCMPCINDYRSCSDAFGFLEWSQGLVVDVNLRCDW